MSGSVIQLIEVLESDVHQDVSIIKFFKQVDLFFKLNPARKSFTRRDMAQPMV